MASMQSFYTAFTGLDAHARSIDVIGNNIANVNTTAFKSSRATFADLFYHTRSGGNPPGDGVGGSNPAQVGSGVRVAGTLRDHTLGTISATGNPQDLAIDGEGFFLVGDAAAPRFTRDGSLRLNGASELVTSSGARLLGWGVDADLNVQPGQLRTLHIPLGEMSISEATSSVRITGNLNAAGDLATRGTRVRLLGEDGSGLRAIEGAQPGENELIAPATLLRDVADPADPDAQTPLFQPGQTIKLAGARKGGRSLPPAQLAIGAATTVRDLMDFLAAALGIQGSEPNGDGRQPGVGLNRQNGAMLVDGDSGLLNDIELGEDSLRLLDASGLPLRTPFAAETLQHADGESVRTTFAAFDSLGNPVEVDAALTMVGRGDAGTRWRYDLESAGNRGLALALGSGELAFDTAGRLLTTDPVGVSIDRAGTGAASPLSFDLAFSGGGERMTALADVSSQIATTHRDGASRGVLQDYTVDRDGTILGAFSNTLVRPLGRVALARFPNPEGLEQIGDNLFRPGVNSGAASVLQPGEAGAGRIVAGSLELSNVDLGREFTNLILASTGYSASSRVVRTGDEMMRELLTLGR